MIISVFDVPKSFTNDFILQFEIVYDSANNSSTYILKFAELSLFIYMFLFLYLHSLLSVLQIDKQLLIMFPIAHCYQYKKKKGLFQFGTQVLQSMIYWSGCCRLVVNQHVREEV